MISILNTRIYSLLLAGLVLHCGLFGSIVHAQSSVSLSITPTKFDIRAAETQSWTSELRVINTNQFPLVVYADAVNFAPRGEGGDGQFVPILEAETQGQTLAEWITLPAGAIEIPPEQTRAIPITISVPAGASPGGHYAAILVSTQPPVDDTDASRVRTAQAVTSLVFMRVAGDIVERGSIREFTTARRVASSPTMDFALRFENLGNVHIQPRGEIVITNMWGQERGIIPINQRSTFGDVLPEQTRRFNFSWSGEWSLADMGRYQALVTVTYGDQTRQFDSRSITFWVIPWQWFLGIFASLAVFISIIVLGVRRYVRKMLLLSGIDPNLASQRGRALPRHRPDVSITAPIEVGLLDLRSRLRTSQSKSERLLMTVQFLREQRWFFGTLAAFVVLIVGVWWFVTSALSPSRPYEVLIEQGGELIPVSSTDSEVLPVVQSDALTVRPQTAPPIAVVNHSGVAGTAARARVLLEQYGYQVAQAQSDTTATESRTFIVYGPRYKDVALDLSGLLGNVLISAYAPADTEPVPITIYVGTDNI